MLISSAYEKYNLSYIWCYVFFNLYLLVQWYLIEALIFIPVLTKNSCFAISLHNIFSSTFSNLTSFPLKFSRSLYLGNLFITWIHDRILVWFLFALLDHTYFSTSLLWEFWFYSELSWYEPQDLVTIFSH